jgi:hypothetical protein
MKLKMLISGFIFLFAFRISLAQSNSLLKMSLQQRNEQMKNMPQHEKSEALRQFKEDLVLSELQIPENKKENFLAVYNDYQVRQREIKSKFKHSRDFNNMTEEEANVELENSFEVGQQLLDLRREYTERFRQIITPQKILQLFQTEGMMRNKIMKHQQMSQQR